MSEKDDFVPFDKALRDLQMRSEELKKLVSEGEIRAFRDGDSMKFRSEDIAALGGKGGDDELSFADSLEDDTGMVTEQLSAEDTLLADDDEVVEDRPRRNSPRVAQGRATKAAAAVEETTKEPGWVTAMAILGFLLSIWGFMIAYSIGQESDPAGNMFTSMFVK